MHAVALYEQVFRPAVVIVARGAHDRRQSCLCGRNLEVIVAVNTGDLLDDVGLDGDILRCTPGRHVRGEDFVFKRRCEAERGKRIQNLFVGNIDARITVYKFLIERDVDFVVVADIDVRHGGDDLHTRVDLGEQLHEVLDGDVGHFRVKGFLITHGSIRAQTDARGGLAHAYSVKVCGFEQQTVRVIFNLGVETAHDARDGDRFFLGADHQRVFVDAALCAVQRFKLERSGEALHLNGIDLCAVERVHRLAELEHEVVCEVGKQVDGTHAAVKETNAHINRADLLRDVAHLEARVAVAELFIADIDIDARQRSIGGEIHAADRL